MRVTWSADDWRVKQTLSSSVIWLLGGSSPKKPVTVSRTQDTKAGRTSFLCCFITRFSSGNLQLALYTNVSLSWTSLEFVWNNLFTELCYLFCFPLKKNLFFFIRSVVLETKFDDALQGFVSGSIWWTFHPISKRIFCNFLDDGEMSLKFINKSISTSVIMIMCITKMDCVAFLYCSLINCFFPHMHRRSCLIIRNIIIKGAEILTFLWYSCNECLGYSHISSYGFHSVLDMWRETSSQTSSVVQLSIELLLNYSLSKVV